MTPEGGGDLAALEARLAYELACLQLPAPRWTPERTHEGQRVADVAIVGAGMAGLALAAALVQRGVFVVVYDERPDALCVEPQTAPPDAINLTPGLVRPGSPRSARAVWSWSPDS